MLQEGEDDQIGRRALGKEDPEYSLLEHWSAFEIADPVVREGSGQAPTEAVGQVFAVNVQAVQVAVKVLTRAVDPFVGPILF
ncbi:MAG TPA: hypothetical protein VIM47_03590, partial [Dermatophilaceae bacterium]